MDVSRNHPYLCAVCVWLPSLPPDLTSSFSQGLAYGGKPYVVLVFLVTKRAQPDGKSPEWAREMALRLAHWLL